MKIKIAKDEWYPVFTPTPNHHDFEIEVSEKELKDIEDTFKKFYEIQDFILERKKNG